MNWLRRWKEPTQSQRHILNALRQGWTLKSHRYLDGRKRYQLHSLQGERVDLVAADVDKLVTSGWIHSNQKFPAATFLLSERGRALCDGEAAGNPLGSQRFSSV